MRPTDEQQRAIDAFLTGENLIIEAGAGTGKTTTLKQMGAAAPKRSGLYIAYNAAIARDAAATFPDNVECRTAHSLAYRAIAKRWGPALRARLNAPRVPATETARRIGSNYLLQLAPDLIIQPTRVATIAMQTVKRWCYTGDPEITASHVDYPLRVDGTSERAQLAEAIVPMAQSAWADLSRPDGTLRFAHDHYLKIFALGQPTLHYDYLFVDEAQDSNGVVTAIVGKQQHAQIAAVGDRCQAIYGWRGATDAMDAFGAKHHVYLTQSWRFGQPIADEANKWLEVLKAELRLTGDPNRNSVVEDTPAPRAILCRTNAEVIKRVISSHETGVKVALVGGGTEIINFARAARDLMDTGRTHHHELFAFTSWSMVEEYVDEAHDGNDLKVLVDLINEHSPEGITKAIGGCVDEAIADVTVSTAHKAKGREWSSVKIAEDFDPGDDPAEAVSDEEAMLAYVAVTRAQDRLDRAGLAWIDDLLRRPEAPEGLDAGPTM